MKSINRRQLVVFFVVMTALILQPASAFAASVDVNIESAKTSKLLMDSLSLENIYSGAPEIGADGVYTLDVDVVAGPDAAVQSSDFIELLNVVNGICTAETGFLGLEYSGNGLAREEAGGSIVSSYNLAAKIANGLDYKESELMAENIANSIKAKASSQREMVVLANQYLVDNAEYGDSNSTDISQWTSYGILKNGIGVCSGYALAFNQIMKYLDIPVVNATGTADGSPHMWNQVYIDGEWLNVDVTYNDPVVIGKALTNLQKQNSSTKYLLKNDHDFFALGTHVQEDREYLEIAKDVFYKNCVDKEADYLKTKGLFLGDGMGYRLNDGLTRAEMAAMLTRVVGAEETVSANQAEYAAKCTLIDVPDWARPYVGFCIENGLVKGIGDNMYGSYNLASKKDFCTVVLRASSLSRDAVSYETSKRDAASLGYLSAGRAPFDELSRGDVVDIVYNMSQMGLF